MANEEIEIYTDGACSGNPAPGGWGAVVVQNGIEEELSGGEELTTNQRMELKAALEALKAQQEPTRVRLYSDSAYLVNAFQQNWMRRWKVNGWKTATGKPVENQDLWKELITLSDKHEVTWIKVKGHSSHYYNDRCDALARGAIPRD